jgi:hypothetical protein
LANNHPWLYSYFLLIELVETYFKIIVFYFLKY